MSARLASRLALGLASTLGLGLGLALAACGDDATPAHDTAAADTDTGSGPGDGGDTGDDGGIDSADDTAPDLIDSVDDSRDAVDGDDGGDAAPETTPDTGGDTAADATEHGEDGGPEVEGSDEPLDDDLEPCDHPEYWPFSLRSATRPLRVHYRMPRDEAAAKESLAILEHAWTREIDEVGWDAPIPDGGACGPDEALDVFTWRDAPYAYVNIWIENDATPWDDGSPYMVVDPWGEYGGDELPATLAHEFNHMCQTSYDWSDATFVYEATATFMEDVVYDDHDSYWYLLPDFQAHPEWALDHFDDYQTWFMYGAALYFRFLRDRFYEGDPAFIADMWEGMRSGWEENEPDYIDSLEAMLAREGSSFVDSIVEFARWRWYVNVRDDGRHLEEAGDFPRDAMPAVGATVQATGGSTSVRVEMLGSVYIDVRSTADGPQRVHLTLEDNSDAAELVVQVVPGLDGSDGETLRLPADVALTDVDGRIQRTVIVTAVPGPDVDIDPDVREGDRHNATLTVAPL